MTVSDLGGTYTGAPIAATATVTGVGGTATPDLEGVTPTLTYYAGSGTSGTDLGSAAPSAAGTYTVVARFPGSADYAAAQSKPATFVIAPAAATITLTSLEQLARLRTDRHLRRDGELRRRHAGRDGHLRRRHHPAGHSPAERLRSGRTDDLDPDPGLARDHGDLQRRHRLPRSEVGHGGRVGQPGGTAIVLVPHAVLKGKKKLKAVELTAEIEPVAPGGGVPTGAGDLRVRQEAREEGQGEDARHRGVERRRGHADDSSRTRC